MKKLYFITYLFLFAASYLCAQTEKGKIYMGGQTDLNFSTASDKVEIVTSNQTNFGIAPQVGYFLIDNMLMGVQIPVSYSNSRLRIGNEKIVDNTKSLMCTPFLKYFFGENRITPFVFSKVSYGINKRTLSSGAESNSNSSSISGYGLGSGLAFFLNDNVSADLSVGYAGITENPKEDNRKSYTVRGLESSIGIAVYLK